MNTRKIRRKSLSKLVWPRTHKQMIYYAQGMADALDTPITIWLNEDGTMQAGDVIMAPNGAQVTQVLHPHGDWKEPEPGKQEKPDPERDPHIRLVSPEDHD